MHPASESNSFEPNIAFIIRSKNNASGVEQLFDTIKTARSSYGGRIDTILVDTESQDGTLDLAEGFGAHVASIAQQDFTYPKSLNQGLEAVADDVDVAFLTVDHALPVFPDFLRGSVQHFSDPSVVGAYGIALPSATASTTERIFGPKHIGRSRRIPAVRMGVLGATNAMIRMSTWKQHPFDDAYAGGGEDTEWARQAIKRGEGIVYEPALNVYHSHGLTAIQSLKQWLHWRKVLHGPTPFKQR